MELYFAAKVQLLEDFIHACYVGSLGKAKKLAPQVDINGCCERNHTTGLCAAVLSGNWDIVSFLLDYPEIDVNKPNPKGETPFSLSLGSISSGALERTSRYYTPLIQRLLLDPRVNVNLADRNGLTPLHRACGARSLLCVKVLLALPHSVNTKALTSDGYTARDFWLNFSETSSEEREFKEVEDLLRSYDRDPVETRHRLLKELGYPFPSQAASLFALVIFSCDNLLKIKD